MFETIEFCDELLPRDQPRYLMGVGRPSDLIKGVLRGIDMFDCVMPTRNGRNGHIFTQNGVINIRNQKYKNDFSPLDSNSSHKWGQIYSKSYVRHLFNINEILGLRIASKLNLVFVLDLMNQIREKIELNTFESWSREKLNLFSNFKGM